MKEAFLLEAVPELNGKQVLKASLRSESPSQESCFFQLAMSLYPSGKVRLSNNVQAHLRAES